MTLIEKWPRSKALQVRAIIERVDLCGCGTGTHWECFSEILVEAEKHTNNGFYRDKWFEFGAKILDDKKLLEHGSSIGYAWLTDDGKLLLEFIRDFGIEGHDVNSGAGHPVWSDEGSWDESAKPHDAYSRWADSAGHGLRSII